jgi:hypothetical protein
MNYDSHQISFSVRLSLIPTALLAVAIVASALMLSARAPETITITPAPVVIETPTPITVQVHTTVRPRIIVKKVVVMPPPPPPLKASVPDPIFKHRTPIIPDSLKKSNGFMTGFGLGWAAMEMAKHD